MKSRPLGATGLEVSEIGFGAWGIGGSVNGAVSYGPTDDRTSMAALRRAFELGITFYDTADLYGYGHSESLIGAVLGDVRSEIVIATKVGLVGPYGPHDFSPGHVRQSLEQSLRRLGTDYVDLYQLHNPPLELLRRDAGILETMQRLQQDGRIRRIGASVRSPEDGLAAIRELGFKCIQVNFNMVDQRAMENGLIDLCRAEGVGLICRTPLCYGFLSGTYAPTSQFDAQDHRAAWSPEQIARWADAPRRFAQVVPRAEQTPAQAALRFCLSYPGVSTVIPGMCTRDHVEENVAASDLGPLLERDRRAIEDVYRATEFFVGRAGSPPGVRT